MITLRVGDVQPPPPHPWWIGLKGHCSVCKGRFQLDEADSIGADVVGAFSMFCPTPNCTGQLVFSNLTISVQPKDQSITAGGNVTFTAEAISSDALTYQWQFNGVDILNATGASYTITEAQPENAGTYACQITNASGKTKTTTPAVLTVT